MISDARSKEFTSVRDAVRSWGRGDEAIVAVALVGSWARGEPRMDSDADVVVLVDTDRFVEQDAWVGQVCGQQATLVRTVDWGALTERRVRLPSGFEIEFGFADPSWADVGPVDPGTRGVVTNGCEIWYDPHDVLSRLLAGVAE